MSPVVVGGSVVPFKHHCNGRDRIPRQKHRVAKWRVYDAALRNRGSLTIWYTEGALAGRKHRRQGRRYYSDMGAEPEALHLAFSSRCPLSAVRLQVVGDQPIGNEVIFLQQLAHQFQRRVLVSPGPNQDIEDLAFGVDRAPEIDYPAVDFQVDLKAKSGVANLSHRRR